ncbi:hypothetical protein OG21DRAFT_1506037, partial [Imleria badia]
MSLDHFPLFAERRFQPSERVSYPSHDHLASWSYSSRASPDAHAAFPHQMPSSWNTAQYPAWSAPPVAYSSPPPPSPPPYVALNPTYRHSAFTLFHQTDYPASSSRPLMNAIQPTIPSSLSPTTSSVRPAQSSLSSIAPNPKYDSHPWGDGLYTIDDPDTASNSERPASSVATSPSARASSISSSASIPPVKVEEDSVASDCFVMEFSAPTPAAQASTSLAPPTEVPLRATQASKAMRKMMGVFRLNPFSMHESGAQPTTTWTGEEAGPLEEEPQMFEFQLDLPGYERAPSDPVQPQPPSADKPGGDFDDAASWAECNEPTLHYPSDSHPAWLGNDSPASYTLPSLRPYSPHPPLHSPSPSSVSPRRPPLDNHSSEYASPYTLPMPSSCATSIDNLPPISTMARRWSSTTSLQHPFI